ncbi:MAG: hypothetical protein KJ067_22310 [Vicinamibacteria bacterium]|nr:hypothetical protein [Vicinamibacteria bacterium]
MSLLPSPRPRWFAGAVTLSAAAAVTAVISLALGIKVWSIWLGLLIAAVLLIGQAERLMNAPRVPREHKLRKNLRLIRGGKSAPYDLARDETTNNQRWLM